MLEISNLHKRFNGVVAVNDLSFHVGDAELIGLIGPNGAGKTTVFNLVSGVLHPDQGKVVFKNQDITNKKAHKIASLGLTRTFQQNMLFDNQTCLENIRVASQLHEEKRLLQFAFGFRTSKDILGDYEQNSRDILTLMGLGDYADTLAGSLPQGLKRILGVAMAWATNPKVLLLDEPAAGMSLTEIQNLKELIFTLHDFGVAILLVEHNVKFVTEICQRVIVLNFGRLISEGTPKQVMSDEQVVKAYLGQ
jgi:branched-chain amino acid transport system ATP-binding protein